MRLCEISILIVLAFPTFVSGEEMRQGMPDIRSLAADLKLPALLENGDKPSAGARFRYVHPKWEGTGVYAVVYLPTDWSADKKFPMIAEFPGNGGFRNRFGDTCSGRPEGCQLGYGISGGSEFIWISLPFVNEKGDDLAITWWGDKPKYSPEPTVSHTKAMVEQIAEKFSGNKDRVILSGFSRGSIACNFIGLHDEEISKLWCGMVAFSHYDGEREGWPYPEADRAAAFSRLARLGERPQFICYEGGAKIGLTQKYLEKTGTVGDFTFLPTGFRNHNDAWVLRSSAAREILRVWIKRVTK